MMVSINSFCTEWYIKCMAGMVERGHLDLRILKSRLLCSASIISQLPKGTVGPPVVDDEEWAGDEPELLPDSPHGVDQTQARAQEEAAVAAPILAAVSPSAEHSHPGLDSGGEEGECAEVLAPSGMMPSRGELKATGAAIETSLSGPSGRCSRSPRS